MNPPHVACATDCFIAASSAPTPLQTTCNECVARETAQQIPAVNVPAGGKSPSEEAVRGIAEGQLGDTGGALRSALPETDGDAAAAGAQQRKLSRRSETPLPQHAAGDLACPLKPLRACQQLRLRKNRQTCPTLPCLIRRSSLCGTMCHVSAVCCADSAILASRQTVAAVEHSAGDGTAAARHE